jgi:hypothetical protein
MGEVSGLVTALAVLGIMKARDAREEDRKSRQEEAFVPFRLPPLLYREQSICESVTEAWPPDALAMSAARSIP